MRKLIHSSFELDLTPFKISDTEENNWFSDNFFLKYSFPFDIDLEDDLDIAFGFISQHNSDTPKTYFDLLYVHGDKIEKAVLEVESIQDKLSCVLRYGFEQLPSWDKNLNELSLDKFDLSIGTTIYEHAQTIITQTWPAVNYNFPQVHVDKYDTTDLLWEYFGGILNNRISGAFLENSVDLEGVSYNRNIMQPLPYFLHILQRGMIDAGYILSGKILTDDFIKKSCLYGDIEYFKKPSFQDPIDIIQMSEDCINIVTNPVNGRQTCDYYFHSELANPGRYSIVGSVKLFKFYTTIPAYIKIKYRNTVIYEFNVSNSDSRKDIDIDIAFETIVDGNIDDITVESHQYLTSGFTIIDLSVICLNIFDGTGEIIPFVENEKKVDLTKAVPSITFGDFVKVIKNWFNYDLTIEDNLAIMNPIEDEINYDNAEDLQFAEIKKPLRNFTQGNSFLLKFQDIENKDYKFVPIFQNKDGFQNSGYVTDDKTTTIEINALPLPLLNRNGAQTAYAFESNDSKVYLIKYDGIYNGNNFAQSTIDYLIPAVHGRYWKKWFEFRIFAQAFSWGFKAWDEQIIKIKAKRKIFAYGRFHIIKNINKTETKPEQFTVEIVTNTLK